MRLNMRGRFIAAFILLLLPVAATGRPIEQGRFLPKVDQLDASGRKDMLHSDVSSVFRAATTGTTSGHLMGNGVYFIRLRALDQELSGKLVLVGKRG